MQKIMAVINCIIFAVLIFAFTVLSIISPKKRFSENENRLLAQLPVFSMDALFYGSYTFDYETYLTDQFVYRDSWITLKTIGEVSLKKKEINDVYLGKDGYLFEAYPPDSINQEQMEKNETRLIEFAQHYTNELGAENVKIMLVPTASDILKTKLPDFVKVFEQQQVVNRMKESLPENVFVDTSQVLKQHEEDYIFYRTDHHWTTKGAYYAYREWAEQCGFTPRQEKEYLIKEVTDKFRGSTYSRLNVDFVKPDRIFLYLTNENYRVEYNLDGVIKNKLYEMHHLETKDKYSVFLDGNHPFVKIDSDYYNDRRLLIIKDSYANCFAPFAAEHYESVYMIDLRHMNLPVSEFIEQHDITDVLVLYNVKGFVSESTVYKIVR